MRELVLDMDSSVSETYGGQEGTAFNGHFDCTCYHPCLASINSATWNEPCCGKAMSIAPRLARRVGTRGGPLSPPEVATLLSGGCGLCQPGGVCVLGSRRLWIRHPLASKRCVTAGNCAAVDSSGGTAVERAGVWSADFLYQAQVGIALAVWWPRWSGTRASCSRASGSS